MSDDVSVRESVVVEGENGLHMIPCSRIAHAAREAEAEIRVLKDDVVVDARNVTELLTLGAVKGTSLVLEGSGVDAAAAIAKIVELFRSNFEVTDS